MWAKEKGINSVSDLTLTSQQSCSNKMRKKQLANLSYMGMPNYFTFDYFNRTAITITTYVRHNK